MVPFTRGVVGRSRCAIVISGDEVGAANKGRGVPFAFRVVSKIVASTSMSILF